MSDNIETEVTEPIDAQDAAKTAKRAAKEANRAAKASDPVRLSKKLAKVSERATQLEGENRALKKLAASAEQRLRLRAMSDASGDNAYAPDIPQGANTTPNARAPEATQAPATNARQEYQRLYQQNPYLAAQWLLDHRFEIYPNK